MSGPRSTRVMHECRVGRAAAGWRRSERRAHQLAVAPRGPGFSFHYHFSRARRSRATVSRSLRLSANRNSTNTRGGRRGTRKPEHTPTLPYVHFDIRHGHSQPFQRNTLVCAPRISGTRVVTTISVDDQRGPSALVSLDCSSTYTSSPPIPVVLVVCSSCSPIPLWTAHVSTAGRSERQQAEKLAPHLLPGATSKQSHRLPTNQPRRPGCSTEIDRDRPPCTVRGPAPGGQRGAPMGRRPPHPRLAGTRDAAASIRLGRVR